MNCSGRCLLAISLGALQALSGEIARAQTSSHATVEEFVPPGYSVVFREEADFNGDGLRDALLVLASKKTDSYDTPRPLVILFREAAGGYSLSIRSDQAIPEAGSGGIASIDGFEGIKVKNNGFVISQFGGSSIRHSAEWKFRFQNGDWYLIGETELIGGPGVSCPPIKRKKVVPCGAYKMDTNFLTGNQIGVVYFDEGRHTVRRSMQKRHLVRLSTFYPKAWANFQW